MKWTGTMFKGHHISQSHVNCAMEERCVLHSKWWEEENSDERDAAASNGEKFFFDNPLA